MKQETDKMAKKNLKDRPLAGAGSGSPLPARTFRLLPHPAVLVLHGITHFPSAGPVLPTSVLSFTCLLQSVPLLFLVPPLHEKHSPVGREPCKINLPPLKLPLQ